MDEKIIENIYKDTKKVIANSDIYFYGHAVPVARMAKRYAIQFGADPLTCEIAGLLHDIGYSEKYDLDKKDHIVKGVKIAKEILMKYSFKKNDVQKIISCIQTHDNHLKKNSSLENVIVHDSDLLVAFDSIPVNVALMGKWGVSYSDALDRIEEDIKKKITWIHHHYFKDLAKDKLIQFNTNLSCMRSQNESK